MKTYEVLFCEKWMKVKGWIMPSGWLEWKTGNITGLSRPGKFRKPARKTRSLAPGCLSEAFLDPKPYPDSP